MSRELIASRGDTPGYVVVLVFHERSYVEIEHRRLYVTRAGAPPHLGGTCTA